MNSQLDKLLHEILSRLNTVSHEHEVLRSVMGTYAAALQASDELRDLVTRIQTDESLALVRQDLERRKRVLKLLEVGQWTAELATARDDLSPVSDGRKNAHGVTIPTCFIFASIGTQEPCVVEYWTSDAPEGADPLTVKGSRLGTPSRVSLDRWEFWAPPGTNVVVRMVPARSRPVWLRFIGPQVSDYAHGYEIESGAYSHSSFANLDFTANEFLAIMMHEFVRAGATDGTLRDEDLRVIAGLGKSMLLTPPLALSSRWRICQTLAAIDPESAVNELKAIAAEGNSLSPLADRALERINA